MNRERKKTEKKQRTEPLPNDDALHPHSLRPINRLIWSVDLALSVPFAVSFFFWLVFFRIPVRHTGGARQRGREAHRLSRLPLKHSGARVPGKIIKKSRTCLGCMVPCKFIGYLFGEYGWVSRSCDSHAGTIARTPFLHGRKPPPIHVVDCTANCYWLCVMDQQ